VSDQPARQREDEKELAMGKIVSNFFISLDGVVESPDQWQFPYFNDEMGAAVSAGIEDSRALLMGRVLYDEWSSYWPTSTDEPFASFINSVPKYVVSNTLDKATWNNTTVVSGDVAEQLRQLREEPGDITMSGSATLVRWLLANGLLDELNLLVHPIVVGRGQRLFEDTASYPLRLTHQKTFQTGVLHVTYAPADK
jgi:dihydrofolate reductase